MARWYLRCAAMAEALHTATVHSKPKVLVIAGTTAVGKTDLSLELARRLNGEVISVDSVQVYKHMDIGSAKVEGTSVPHHLLDVVSPSESFSSIKYYDLASVALQDIISRGRVPMVVGGTGLYLHTLMHGPTDAPLSTPESKVTVNSMLESDEGNWEASVARLAAVDPEHASSLFPNDWYRLRRALEVYSLSGRPLSSYKNAYDEQSSPYEFKCLFLSMPRVQLFHRIDMRCETIIEQGLFDEVISLVRCHGLIMESQAGRSLGYRQALEYLQSVWGFPSDDGTYSLQIPREDLRKSFLQFIYTYQAKTRRLAHSQLFWFKKKPIFHWLNMAPDGERLPMAAVADAVAQWFTEGTLLPQEWDGKGLQELTAEEQQTLKEYTDKHHRLTVYSDETRVDSILQHIETTLRT